MAVAALLFGCGDPQPSAEQLARGGKLYAQHCAACHGAKLEGQPNWRQPLPKTKEVLEARAEMLRNARR